MLSFDIAEDNDYEQEHITFQDGTMKYINGARKGMLFHPYEWEDIEELVKEYELVYKADKGKREHLVILSKLVK